MTTMYYNTWTHTLYKSKYFNVDEGAILYLVSIIIYTNYLNVYYKYVITGGK